jgi:TerC family integral membrane protein
VSAVPVWVWLATLLAYAAIVVLDLVVIGRRRRAVTTADATRWVLFYIGLAAVFAGLLYAFRSTTSGNEFVAGYVMEYSLSVDNLFVFIIIMARFAVPQLAQDKVLYIGIVLSMLMRTVFIVAGAAAVNAASWVFYVFGAFLVYSAVKLALEGENDEDDFQEGRALRTLRRMLPLTKDYQGTALALRVDGRRMLTPLVVVVAAIAIANVVFALDSIPAIFGLTQDAYIVFTANAFALMGLRQLYFLIGSLLDRLVYLNVGLAAILGFVGVKLLLEALHGSGVEHVGHIDLPDIGISLSLEFILAALAMTALASLVKVRLTEPVEDDPTSNSVDPHR